MKKYSIFMIFCLIVLSCSSGSQSDNHDDNGNGPATPPAVTEVSPSADATTFAYTLISAKFSKDMDPATIASGTFILKGASGADVAGFVDYDDENRTATFKPVANLTVPSQYTATVTAGAKDTDGNFLAQDHSWSFTTSGHFFVVLSDTHLRIPGFPDDAYYDSATNYQNLVTAVNTINTNFPDARFVIVTGDLVGCLFSENTADYLVGIENPAETFKSIMDGLAVNYYVALGNHEYQRGFNVSNGEGEMTSDPAAIEAVWKKVLGVDPYYSFIDENIRYTILNSNKGSAKDITCPYLEQETMCTGSFDDLQMTWLEAELSQTEPALLFFHHPLYTDTNSLSWAPLGRVFLVEENDRFYDIADDFREKIMGIFVGHGHWWNYDVLNGSIPVYETGAIGDQFSHADDINIVSVDPPSGNIGVVNYHE